MNGLGYKNVTKLMIYIHFVSRVQIYKHFFNLPPHLLRCVKIVVLPGFCSKIRFGPFKAIWFMCQATYLDK